VRRKRRDGSLHDSPCANTGPRKTATLPSTCKEINTTDPVPLYMVPQVVVVEGWIDPDGQGRDDCPDPDDICTFAAG
jgi:hypothetical protein